MVPSLFPLEAAAEVPHNEAAAEVPPNEALSSSAAGPFDLGSSFSL